MKNSIKAFVSEDPHWEKYLPILLYSIREVPSASTGFSPAELLFGRGPRGPLQVMRDAWTNETSVLSEKKNVNEYLLTLTEKLKRCAELAQENTEKAN